MDSESPAPAQEIETSAVPPVESYITIDPCDVLESIATMAYRGTQLINVFRAKKITNFPFTPSTSEVPIASVGTQKDNWTALVQSARFTNNGKYICGYVDSSSELMQVLENYRTITGTGFTNAQSLSTAMKQFEETIWQQRFMSPSARPRLFWQMNAGEPSIPYDGVPFMSVGQNTELPCVRYGGRRKKVEQVSLTSGEVVPIDYRTKTGCEAKIIVRRILRYPCAEIPNIEQQGIASVRRMRKQVLEELTQKIMTGLAKPTDRYYFLLPTPLSHNGHPVPEIDSAPPLSQLVCDEIINQLSRGVTDIMQLRDHVKSFSDSSFGAEAALHSNDPMYYPTEYDVFRHVYWLYKSGQVIDQESAFRAKLSLPILDQGLMSGLTTTPPKLQPNTESITSVYSIIMDEGGEAGGAATLELSDAQIRTDGEVELNSSGEPGVMKGGVEVTESPIHTHPHTMMMSSSAPVTVSSSPVVRKMKPALVGTGGMSLMSGLEKITPVDNSGVLQAQSECRDMLRIIENQTHACKNTNALNTLRRQLTELCSQFSLHLAGVPTKAFDVPPPAKRMKV